VFRPLPKPRPTTGGGGVAKMSELEHPRPGCDVISCMQRTLQEHIARLEGKIVALKRQLREENLPAYQRSEQELDLVNAEQALNLFRRAYELEQKIPR
jgi:hypothetical protein